tara:strand:+ start:485 stop:1330 length:846 start_codon:yes stop_codon:yes gene_type:complete
MNFENILPKNGPAIEEVKKYIDKYTEDVIVLKIGGSVLLDKILFNQLIEDISILKKIGLNIVTIHGGSKNIKEKLDKAKIESNFIDGLRVTNQKTVKIVEEALLELNNNIIEKLKDKNCEAISFNTNNNIIKVEPISKELGYVGNPKKIDVSLILKTLKNKKVPVIIPMGLDKNENKFNINADTAAGAIAKEIKSRRLLLMTDVQGVMNKENILIPEIYSRDVKQMIRDKTISGGMIPKINTCLDAVNNGVIGCVIVDGRRHHSILFELFSDKGAGTLIRK